jgi:WD40 repeat protein
MAIQDNDFFTPEMVDEQIEQLSPGPHLSQQRITASSQLIRDLRYSYRTNSREEDTRSLQQAWQRISHDKTDLLSQYLEYRQDTSSETGQSANLTNPAFPKQRNLQQRLSMIAAVAVVILLIGSMVLVANFVHPKNASGGTGIATATHKTTNTPASSTISLSQNVGKIVYTASYGFNDIYAVAWSPDSQRIATANNNNVQAIDAANGNHAVNYSLSPAYSVAWSPEGKRIAASSDRVYIWDASSARLLRAYPPASAQPSIQPLWQNGSSLSPLASSHRTVSYISTFSPAKNHIPTSGGNPLLATAWSPNGKLMATAFDGNSNGNTVQVWNTTSGKLILTYHGHNDFIESLSWSPDGTRIASASVDEIVRVWDAITGRTLLTFRGQSRNSEEVHWSPDGKRIAFIGDNNNVLVWNAVTGKTLLVHHQKSRFGISSLVWSPGGALIASAGDTVELWHANTGKTLYTFTKNPHPIRTLSWSPNGKLIASATGPGELGPAPIVLQIWVAS